MSSRQVLRARRRRGCRSWSTSMVVDTHCTSFNWINPLCMCVRLCCDSVLITSLTANRYAGSTVLFEPGNLVSRGGVVVVTLNYRLGMLGFTESPGFLRTDVPGNQAIHDTIMALRWVKDHIANF